MQAIWQDGVLWAQQAAQPPGASGLTSMLPMFLMIGALFYLLILRPQRKEQQERQSMIEGLKKNDRVLTNAGIYGLVMDIRREMNQVTLKVDESNNTKLKVTLHSIARVLAAGDEAPEGSSKP